MAFAKFQGNRFRIYGGIAENHAILVNLTASIIRPISLNGAKYYIRCNEIHHFILYGNGMFRGTNWALNRLELSNPHKLNMLTLLLIHHREGDVDFDQYILQTCPRHSSIFLNQHVCRQ